MNNQSDFPLSGAPVSFVPPGPRPAAPLLVRPLDYDPRSALPAGYVLSRDEEAALFAAWASGFYVPVTQAAAIAAIGPVPNLPVLWPLCGTSMAYAGGDGA